MRPRSSSILRVLAGSGAVLAVSVVLLATSGPPVAAAEEATLPGKIVINHLPGPKLSPFDHPAHVGRAKCVTCHHAGKNVACGTAGCHPAEKAADGPADLKRAFHKQCIPCHARSKASTKCAGACHPKQGA